MSADRHFNEVLTELSPYLDNPPLPDSAEHVRFDALIAEVRRHADVGWEHPHADEINRLGAKIEAITRRRREARHARDMASGSQGMTPMLGGDFHPPGT